jgi:hypothetical protein
MKEIRVWGIGGLLGNGNAEVLEKKIHLAVPLYPRQIPHGHASVCPQTACNVITTAKYRNTC